MSKVIAALASLVRSSYDDGLEDEERETRRDVCVEARREFDDLRSALRQCVEALRRLREVRVRDGVALIGMLVESDVKAALAAAEPLVK